MAFNFVMRAVFLTLALLSLATADSPVPDPTSVVTLGPARFTVLAPEVIRMELTTHRENGNPVWDDRATFSVVNRHVPVPAFTQTLSADGRTLTLTTSALVLTHTLINDPATQNFSAANLQVVLTWGQQQTAKWVPGTADPLHLNGTMDMGPAFPGGMDCYSTPAQCEQQYLNLYGPGLISRSGWAVFDDSTTFRFAAQTGHDMFPWIDHQLATSTLDWHAPVLLVCLL
jgi:hypothetical protein